MQQAVANVKELGQVYRPKTSWLQAFEAFALPSPLAAGSASTPAEQQECRDSLERICKAADIPFAPAFAELQLLLPRAGV